MSPFIGASSLMLLDYWRSLGQTWRQAMHVTLTSDFVGPDGRIKLGEEPLARLRAIPGIEISTIAGRPTNHPLEARDVTACDILIGKRNRLDADLLGLPGFRLKAHRPDGRRL
ncbi:MAG: hypothetical protein H6852_17800 [Geminicoccaceae bacterium]|nr:hypothetical protein [Geminicoccaceae bacterium]